MSVQLLTELPFPLTLMLMVAGFGGGVLTGWHFTGHYYRKLVAALIERNCAITAQMRKELEAMQGQVGNSITSAA